MTFSGKTVLVTGAASGIGLSIAKRFAAVGADVIGLDKNNCSEDISATENSGKMTWVTCDVAKESDLLPILQNILQGHSIDILVNNAAINRCPAAVTETPAALWKETLETNLNSIFTMSKTVIPHMKKGVIINISSILGLVGARNCSAYAVSKAGVISLTKSMALDYAPHIRVNCICPGAVATGMFDEYVNRCSSPQEERERIISAIPLQRLGTPDDIAHAALFLASEQASWITGVALVVDGGDSV